MPYTMLRDTPHGIVDRLNGTVLLGPIPPEGLAVGALTLIFTKPASGTVTFSGSAGDVLSPSAILTAIQSVVAAATIRDAETAGPYYSGGAHPGPYRYIAIQDDTNGVSIDKDGTANSFFGLPKPSGADLVTTPVDRADILVVQADPVTHLYTVILAPEST